MLPLVEDMLSVYLRKNPKYVDNFIDQALYVETSESARINYMKALVVNFTGDFTFWSQKIPETKMYAISWNTVNF